MEAPKYVIIVEKQTSMAGEVVRISANLGAGEDVGAELRKLTAAVDSRLDQLNDEVKAQSNGKIDLKRQQAAAHLGINEDDLKH